MINNVGKDYGKISGSSYYLGIIHFLNQACTGRRLVRAWFLKIDPVQIVSMCVCVRPQGY